MGELYHIIPEAPHANSKYNNMYTYDIALVTQENKYEACELNLTNDMEILN